MGLLLCLVSATGFGLAPLFAKQAYADGVTVTTMLAARFALAAVIFWVLTAVRGARRPAWGTIAVCLGLGAVGYAFQGATYFGSLTLIDASLAALLLYTYPALVTVVAVLLRRESAGRRRIAALVTSGVGLALLLGAGGIGGGAVLGVLMALGAAVSYAVYLTVADGLPKDLDLFLLSAIVCTSAAVSLTVGGAATGQLRGPVAAEGWLWVAVIAVLSTVVPIACMFAGVRLVGASTAAILSGLEPAVTVASTALVFGERLTAGQLAGGAAILAAVVILQVGAQARSAAISHSNAGTAGGNGSRPLRIPSSAQ